MPYWGSGSADSDYAVGAIGVYVLTIKERMFQDAYKVIEKSFPEQGIIASLKCLRLLAGEFPKSVRVHFGKKDFQKSKDVFEEWFELVKDRVPLEYRDAIRLNAESEFALFESQVLIK